MASSTADPNVPNPDTYLNHLLPQEAFEYETSRNVILIFLGATFWDTLATFPEDMRVLRRSHFRPTTFCFIFARCFAVAALAISYINRSGTARSTRVTIFAAVTLYAMSIACSSYLFLQRTLAVYADSPRARQFFIILWMAHFGSGSLLAFTIKPAYIPDTQRFKDAGIQPLLTLTTAGIIFHDSLVFLAISYKIGIAHVVIDREMGWRRFVLGRTLPRLSQAVLRGGQQYYLIVVLVIIPCGILLSVPSTPPILKNMIVVLVAPLMATMSCRVYRNTKLFEYDIIPPYPISEIQFM